MLQRILIPTDLTRASNSVMPAAITMAQAFGSKVYLLHVMDPDALKKPERLVDFPRLSRFFALDRTAVDLPDLKEKVAVGKVYRISPDTDKVILGFARQKQIGMIAMAATDNGGRLRAWVTGHLLQRVLRTAPCSVLCCRGRNVREADWERPRFKHVLYLAELNKHGAAPFLRILPLVSAFNSVLHVLPLDPAEGLMAAGPDNPLQEVARLNPAQTDVLMFAKPSARKQNLLRFVAHTPIDLIVMPHRVRRLLSTPLLSDILSSLMEATASPILLLK